MQTEAIFENIPQRIQHEISKAQKSVYIAVSWFTDENLFNLLQTKAKSGCCVSLIISSNHINSSIDFDQLKINLSKVYKVSNGDTKLMHNKFCVIDYCTVITGLYDWSDKSVSNFENVIITSDDTTLAEQMIAEFHKIRNQYFPDEEKEAVVFPLDKIIKRLEILKNYILLEDIEELSKEAIKLKPYEFNADLEVIILSLKNQEFTKAINKIEHFISNNQLLTVRIDPEIAALKLEIKNLENRLNAFDNEKIELEKSLSEFYHRYTLELGEIILEILQFRKLKFQFDQTKYNEAENDEQQYREQFELEKKKDIFEISPEQKAELKKKFRKASVLCHPDKVSDEYKEAAQRIFIDLKQAYDVNNLEKIDIILNDLEKMNYFKTRSESVTEKDLLTSAIAKLHHQIKALESEIITIKQSDTYKVISTIEDWDEYFKTIKIKLQEELEELKLDCIK